MQPSTRTRVVRIGLGIVVVAGALSVVHFTVGGFDTTVLGIRIRSNDPMRPFLVCVLALLVVALALKGPRYAIDQTARVARVPTLPLACLLAAVVFGFGVRWNMNAATGPDPYGYVSQAELWLNGTLTVDQPWVASAPWPDPAWSFSPLGYRPRGIPRDGKVVEDLTSLSPTYSPGLPMLMAVAKRIAGQAGLFAVVPLLGAALVLATYGIGRRLGSPAAGLLAGWLTATSPILLFMIVFPMSDVPVAGAWAIATWCLLGASGGSALAAGAAAGIAVLIRPNLVPVAGIMGLWLLLRIWRRDKSFGAGLRHAAIFAVGLAPGVAAVALLNRFWYGSPFMNGYGQLSTLFAWSNIPLNAPFYAGLFIEAQTPFALLGVVALFLPRLWSGAASDRTWAAGLFAACFAFIAGVYLPYEHFDGWSFLRFLLPVWPFVMIAFGMAATEIWRRQCGGTAGDGSGPDVQRPGFPLRSRASGLRVSN